VFDPGRYEIALDERDNDLTKDEAAYEALDVGSHASFLWIPMTMREGFGELGRSADALRLSVVEGEGYCRSVHLL